VPIRMMRLAHYMEHGRVACLAAAGVGFSSQDVGHVRVGSWRSKKHQGVTLPITERTADSFSTAIK
jgi:hypothetical protein